VGIFLRQAAAGEPLTVVGDGEQSRDFVHVSDVVAANLLAAKNAAQVAGQVFNIGSGTSVSVLKLAQAFGRAIQHLPPRLGEARHTLADISRARAKLGFNPCIGILDWLGRELSRRGF
jgi:UDP-glucose 4-epimerase